MSDLRLTQIPASGTSHVRFRGDTIIFSLDLTEKISGKAWIRTNLGNIQTSRSEIIQAVLSDEPILGRAWYDIPMTQVKPTRFEIKLALCDVGHFEAKCFFRESGKKTPVWPEGDNVTINVEPADMCCANIIYNAFVRQFGPNKAGTYPISQKSVADIQKLDHEGYAVIPPSGTFRDLVKELDFIIGTLGCRVLHLLPINPTPTTYGRMGRFGSPYAALDFTGIDPALAVFDLKATPLEQFVELVDAVHARNAKIIIDLAPNHTGWAAGLHETHPQWLVRDENGTIQAPGAWGVIWADLTRLNYNNKDLWEYMADVFLLWCNRGVDGFRCDAGYMIPIPAWNFIVAIVRQQFPDTIFFLEGLGGKISVTKKILSLSNFNWAYSELFQNYNRNEIETYFPLSNRISLEDGLMIHFAETHDNNRLAAISTAYAANRTALCALVSNCGGFGFANGVEWLATQKINVHDACSLNWGADNNQVDLIRRINLLLKFHPAFFDRTRMQMIQEGDGNYIAVLRHHLPTDKRLLVLVNLDMHHPVQARWNPAVFEPNLFSYIDMLSGRTVSVTEDNGQFTYDLSPGYVCCLSPTPEDLIEYVHKKNHTLLPDRIHLQCLRSVVLEIYRFFIGSIKLSDFHINHAVQRLVNDPEQFCRSLNPYSEESRLIIWQWPYDSRRQVMIPPNHLLMVRSDISFKARIVISENFVEKTMANHRSLKCDDETHFAIFLVQQPTKNHFTATLKISVYNDNTCTHVEAPLLYLANHKHACVQKIFDRKDILNRPLRFLGTNGRGAMLRVNAKWGNIESRYDALLSANLNPDYPDNRWMMLIRCRAWIVFQGFSSEISTACLKRFSFDYEPGDYESGCRWEFAVPTGQGQHIILRITARMIQNKNQICLSFTRPDAAGKTRVLPNDHSVKVIIRPDIDDRSFHSTTKAYTGPEHQWPSATLPTKDGFSFKPHPDRTLQINSTSGEFVWEPEWRYMISLSTDAERGMDPHTDLFSPGYFSALLQGNESLKLSAAILSPGYSAAPATGLNKAPAPQPLITIPEREFLLDSMRRSLKHFIVQRNSYKSVIAGYPWFLDWGRDTLIVSRGLIASGFISETKSILKQFAAFEHQGTLPNMIFGADTQNRDTSDAPLWFAAACKNLVRKAGDMRFIDEKCGDRSIRDVLRSIVNSYIKGTPNGINMDPETGLVFSPSHFTWMDTNSPAATPREGYPIEIQALWYHALKFMVQIDHPDHAKKWKNLADRVFKSVRKLFYMEQPGYLSDCLYASSGMSAKDANADDALRPNQLFAITLGAVTDQHIMENVIRNCASLVIPGAIRSLADQPVKKPLKVIHNGHILNDPYHPYQGFYSGDEDTQRKPAYHNGTAWTWIFPSFCEAWVMAFGKHANETALALMASSSEIINIGCAGHLPEIMDGDYPHHQKGCDAQAWGVSEWLRVWIKLTAS
ncbi:MAG: glycogen debranching protein [Desulfobacteraceae bacterium]|nr:glycogen debranching enzyme N-terminal domain-containing protein [Desulfobacteraceae bacterium]MBC2755967.1 glycogen debranching protein [Desulfobacteraceae bacterium]